MIAARKKGAAGEDLMPAPSPEPNIIGILRTVRFSSTPVDGSAPDQRQQRILDSIAPVLAEWENHEDLTRLADILGMSAAPKRRKRITQARGLHLAAAYFIEKKRTGHGARKVVAERYNTTERSVGIAAEQFGPLLSQFKIEENNS